MVLVYVWGAWGMDGGWMPLPTRLQRYCDPASLVKEIFRVENMAILHLVPVAK